VLKISQQKFIGLTRSDKNNEMYWKFRDFYEGTETPIKTTASTVPNQPEPRPKTPEPQSEKEPEVNFPPSAETNSVQVEGLESEAVKKFREKYGSPSNPQGPTQ
jgi:hypothetical protein